RAAAGAAPLPGAGRGPADAAVADPPRPRDRTVQRPRALDDARSGERQPALGGGDHLPRALRVRLHRGCVHQLLARAVDGAPLSRGRPARARGCRRAVGSGIHVVRVREPLREDQPAATAAGKGPRRPLILQRPGVQRPRAIESDPTYRSNMNTTWRPSGETTRCTMAGAPPGPGGKTGPAS